METFQNSLNNWAFQGRAADLSHLDELHYEASIGPEDLPKIATLWGQILANEFNLQWDCTSSEWLISAPSAYFKVAICPRHRLEEVFRNANPESQKLAYAYEKAAVHIFIQSCAYVEAGSSLTLPCGGFIQELEEVVQIIRNAR